MDIEDCIVRIWNNGSGEAIIFFPDRTVNRGMVDSWMHIGQHSEAHIDIMTLPITRKATKGEALAVIKLYETQYDCKLHNLQRVAHSRLTKNWNT